MPVHGRRAEQAVIASVLAAPRHGRSGVLVVRGPAGVGKSTLLELAVEGAGDLQVLRARGVESEAELPFAGLHQLLHPVLDHLPVLATPQRRALATALGLEDGPSNAGPSERFLVALAVLGLLGSAAEQSPVVCVVDDAHWLDHASASAMLFVARRLGADPVAVLLAVRDPDPRSLPAADLPELQVGGLDVDAAAALLAERAATHVDPGVCEQLVHRTEGNPLVLSELPSVLTAEQLAGLAPLPSPLPLPSDVGCVFADRVQRLPDDARSLLLLVAAEDSGDLARLTTAARVLGLPDDALEAAETSGLVVVREGIIGFRHPLVRSVVYQAATTLRRREAHRALASASGTVGDADRQAWHAAAAALEPEEAVAADLEQAAARACDRGGFEAATAALVRAADLSSDVRDRCRRLVSAAGNAWNAGHLGEAAKLLLVARPLAPDVILRTDVDRLRGWLEFTIGSPATAHRILVDAAGAVASRDSSRARAMLAAAAESAWLSADEGVGVEIRRVMTGLAPARDDRDRLLADLLTGFLAFLEGRPRESVPLIAGAVTAAERLGDRDLLAAAAQNAHYIADDDAALRLTTREAARARADGAAADLLFALPRLIHAELLHGHWTAAAAGASEALRLADSMGDPELAALPLAWLTLLSSLRGDLDGSRRYAARAGALAERHPLGVYRQPMLQVIRWAGATEKLAAARPVSAFVLVDGIDHPVVAAMATADRVQAAARADHRERAQRWSADAEEFAAATHAPWAEAMAAHCRAVLSEGAVAAELFAEALRRHEGSRRPFDRGRTLLAYGEFLRRSRRRVQARAHLAAALDLFEGLGAAPWAERARSELRACGEASHRRDPSAVLRLTPQELQVARFVATGLPTRAVAAQLFLSPRTVDFHLRNVFTKLGISSRAELAAHRLD
ncbi:helix-turn-helix transcriptional regulator [Geodermatophilus marinus]|uniref:helix-turn-helix transcriptional regulator n=1 Tax=Geodermatophilus sp. LHW52908 TaxID=2303986 RepID=UPI0011C11C9A|nr:helix-turn-helix transcriptional regulator [Geodermatophilus sp. LHW52908]